MYAKLLLRRNNAKRPSEMRRRFILRPNPWCERRHLNRTDPFLELFLQARTPAGTLKTFILILFASTFLKIEATFGFTGLLAIETKKLSNLYSQINQLAKILAIERTTMKDQKGIY